MTTVRDATLADLKPDPRNPRRHTPRNAAAVSVSVAETGAGRSLLAAADGTLIAGNLTADVMAELGMDDIIIVESDGTRPIVHVRTDLEPGSPAAIKAGIYDNRASDLAGGYHPDVLAALVATVPIAPTALSDGELAAILAYDPDRDALTIDHTTAFDHDDPVPSDDPGLDAAGIANRYLTTGVRQIVFIMDADTYVAILPRIESAMTRAGVATTVALLHHLLDVAESHDA